MIFPRFGFADALRLTVDEEFDFIGIVVVGPHVNFLSRLPVPMREEVKHSLVGAPLRLIHIIYVFRDAGKVYNAEVGTAGRPAEGCRLSEVVESGPDELTGDEVF